MAKAILVVGSTFICWDKTINLYHSDVAMAQATADAYLNTFVDGSETPSQELQDAVIEACRTIAALEPEEALRCKLRNEAKATLGRAGFACAKHMATFEVE
eukprot:TRINITY_DN6403_c0_g1_i1.p1 TRINITY_DN6403_c0_g1~~TRINITY_DN6403_c0_g1_i1.p1  ORF type:complete len:101 (+),score=19.34 TRINITY_DN6403_c0_g1_i1:50-352(+)